MCVIVYVRVRWTVGDKLHFAVDLSDCHGVGDHRLRLSTFRMRPLGSNILHPVENCNFQPLCCRVLLAERTILLYFLSTELPLKFSE